MKHFIYNQHRERFAILDKENIKICGRITKLEAIKIQFLCFLSHLQKIQFLVSNMQQA